MSNPDAAKFPGVIDQSAEAHGAAAKPLESTRSRHRSRRRYPHTAWHGFRAATECRHLPSDHHDSRRNVTLRDAGTGSRSVSRPSPLGLWWTLSRPGHIWFLARVGAVDGTRTGLEPATARLATWCPTIGRPHRRRHVQNPYTEYVRLTQKPNAPPAMTASRQALKRHR